MFSVIVSTVVSNNRSCDNLSRIFEDLSQASIAGTKV